MCAGINESRKHRTKYLPELSTVEHKEKMAEPASKKRKTTGVQRLGNYASEEQWRKANKPSMAYVGSESSTESSGGEGNSADENIEDERSAEESSADESSEDESSEDESSEYAPPSPVSSPAAPPAVGGPMGAVDLCDDSDDEPLVRKNNENGVCEGSDDDEPLVRPQKKRHRGTHTRTHAHTHTRTHAHTHARIQSCTPRRQAEGCSRARSTRGEWRRTRAHCGSHPPHP
jgi:hypothetical protein